MIKRQCLERERELIALCDTGGLSRPQERQPSGHEMALNSLAWWCMQATQPSRRASVAQSAKSRLDGCVLTSHGEEALLNHDCLAQRSSKSWNEGAADQGHPKDNG